MPPARTTRQTRRRRSPPEVGPCSPWRPVQLACTRALDLVHLCFAPPAACVGSTAWPAAWPATRLDARPRVPSPPRGAHAPASNSSRRCPGLKIKANNTSGKHSPHKFNRASRNWQLQKGGAITSPRLQHQTQHRRIRLHSQVRNRKHPRNAEEQLRCIKAVANQPVVQHRACLEAVPVHQQQGGSMLVQKRRNLQDPPTSQRNRRGSNSHRKSQGRSHHTYQRIAGQSLRKIAKVSQSQRFNRNAFTSQRKSQEPQASRSQRSQQTHNRIVATSHHCRE